MNLQDNINRGVDAEKFLNSDIYKDAVAKVKRGIVEAMERAAIGDEKTHTKLVITLQLMNKLEKNIKEVVETGKLSRIELENKNIFGFRRWE